MAQLVFVYGRFKKSGKQHYLFKDARFIGEDCTQPHFTMLHLKPAPIPLVLGVGKTSIKGEVYSVTDFDYQNILLKYENVPVFSIPKLIKTVKHRFICVMFIMSPSLLENSKQHILKYPIVKSGFWSNVNEASSVPAVEDGKC